MGIGVGMYRCGAVSVPVTIMQYASQSAVTTLNLVGYAFCVAGVCIYNYQVSLVCLISMQTVAA